MRSIRYLLTLAALVLTCAALPVAAQEKARVIVTGTVTDADSSRPLRLVTVRAAGTTMGAMTNATGRYVLRLPPGHYTIAFSMVGYETRRFEIDAGGDTIRLDAVLRGAVVQRPEVVVSAEDPGVKLMRRVLKRKEEQRDSLDTYSYMLFTRFVAATDTLTAGRTDAPRDTTVISIFESYSRGYFREPNSYFNEIIQRRQSANVPPQANFVAFGTNLNAYDDAVTILGEEIFTPFHPDALDYYDFVLESTSSSRDSVRSARVRVTPRGDGRRLFNGWVTIDTERLVPLSVDLAPNRAVRLPFDAALTYEQHFDVMDGRFVMPTGMRIESTLRAELFWIVAPRLDVTIETVAYDYACNVPLDDALFEQRRVEIAESAATFDSAYWDERIVLPLRPIEAEAYDAIRRAEENPDSVSGTSFIGQFFTDITREVSRLNRKPFTGLDDIVRYNRVHGAYVGLGLNDEVLPWLGGSVSGGYGFSDRRGYGSLGVTVWPDSNHRLAFSGTAYRRLSRRDNPYVVGSAAITTISLLTKNDYGDYYYADGGEVSAELGFGQYQFVRRDLFARPTTIRLFARHEVQRTAGVNATFAVFGGSREFRENPPVIDGVMRTAGAEFNWNFHPMRRISRFGFRLAAEAADPDLLGGDFRFQQYTAALNLRVRTLPLWRLDMRMSAGYSRGAVPPQKFFSLESSFSSTASDGVFRAMSVKEFYGDRYAALTLEHNFGEIIPGVLRIPNIASFGIEFMARGSVGWTSFSPEARLAMTENGPYTLPSTDATQDRIYYEAGLSLNRILIFFRLDLTARFSQRDTPRFFVTIGGG